MSLHDKKTVTRVHGLIQTGVSVAPTDETGAVQLVQVQKDAFRIGTYENHQQFGFASAIPTGTFLTLVSGSGDNSRSLCIATNHAVSRPTGMASGDSQVYDNSHQYIHLSNGTTISIGANNEVDISIGGTQIVQVINNKVTINVNVQVNGTITATGDIMAGSISLTNHVHTGVEGGSDNTGPATGW